ncbi:MAG: Endo-beta-mannanase [Cyanobacteria bacterium RYN_339]|nr:Endo-beta-mannanase [Cyanobacteria bacterium RYN_339]
MTSHFHACCLALALSGCGVSPARLDAAPLPVVAPAAPAVSVTAGPRDAVRTFAAPDARAIAQASLAAQPADQGHALETLWRWLTGPLHRYKPATASPVAAPAWQPQRFMLGANLPWINYGGDFGANAWSPDGGVGRAAPRQKLAATLDRLKAQGITHLRWFMFCDGRAGLRFSADGTPTGVDAYMYADLDAALAEARARGVRITFSVVDFGFFQPGELSGGVQVRGHGDVARDPAKRRAFVQAVLVPLFDKYGTDPVIEAWDAVNEPEWATFGVGSFKPGDAVASTDMRAYIGEVVDAVHGHTRQWATVGSASTRYLGLVKGLGLDVYHAHWYDHFEAFAPLAKPAAKFDLDKPLVLGEFPTKNSKKSVGQILDAVQGAGYAGAMPWSVLATDDATDYAGAEAGFAAWAHDHRAQLAP